MYRQIDRQIDRKSDKTDSATDSKTVKYTNNVKFCYKIYIHFVESDTDMCLKDISLGQEIISIERMDVKISIGKKLRIPPILEGSQGVR